LHALYGSLFIDLTNDFYHHNITFDLKTLYQLGFFFNLVFLIVQTKSSKLNLIHTKCQYESLGPFVALIDHHDALHTTAKPTYAEIMNSNFKQTN